jgi:hypothetical protein
MPERSSAARSACDREVARSSVRPARQSVPQERRRPELHLLQVPFPVRCPEAARQDVPVSPDRLAHRHRVRRAYAAAAPLSGFHLQVGQPSEARVAESPQEPAWRLKAAGAEVLSAASAQRVPSSLPGAAAVGVGAYVRAAPRWAEPAASDAREQEAGAASDARAQPRVAAEPDVEPEAAEAEPGAELAAAVVPGAARQPEVVAAARDAVLRPVAAVRVVLEQRPVAGPSAAAPSAFHRDRPLPWLAP